MGGIGSGRWGGGPTVESCIVLDIDELIRRGALRPNRNQFRSWPATRADGLPLPSTIGLCTRSNEPGVVLLVHLEAGLAGFAQGYPVRLVSDRQPLGGLRWLFLCPVTGARVRKLYVPYRVAGRFASRQAWGLAYATQRQSPRDRAGTRIRKLQKRLTDAPCALRDMPYKPYRMHWTTYHREVAKIQKATATIDAHMMASLAPLLRRLGCR